MSLSINKGCGFENVGVNAYTLTNKLFYKLSMENFKIIFLNSIFPCLVTKEYYYYSDYFITALHDSLFWRGFPIHLPS